MLHAEKDVLTSYLYKARNEIKRLDLDNLQNFLGTLSTQAALLLGFAFTVLTGAPESTENTAVLVGFLQVLTTVTVGAEMYVVCNGMLTTILGPTLALNGPKGSMEKAVMLMRRHRENMFYMFVVGMVGFYGMCCFLFFLTMEVVTAVLCFLIGTLLFAYSFRTARILWDEFAFEEPIYSEKIKVGTDGNPLTANMNTQKALTAAEFLGIDQKEIPNAGKFAQSENSGKKETTPLLTAQGGPDGAASKPKSPLLKGDERAESGVILEARGVVKVHSADPGNGPKADSKSPTKTEKKKKFGISTLFSGGKDKSQKKTDTKEKSTKTNNTQEKPPKSDKSSI